MAIFGWKKGGDTGGADKNSASDGNGATPPPPQEFSPEKARSFFNHAKTAHETTSYEYAMTLWLNGLRFDPTNLEAVVGFFRSADSFLNSKDGSKGPTRDTMNKFAGKGDVDKFLGHLLHFGVKPTDTDSAIRGAQTALTIGARDTAQWLAERALVAAGQEKKARKTHFVSIMEVYEGLQMFDRAVQCGEYACRLDPADAKLQNHVRNLAAESTMTRGGYDEPGKEGGFRKNIKDAEAQRRLEESDRVVKTEDVLNRQIAEGLGEYEKNPQDKPTITKLAKLLLERRTAADVERALEILDKAFTDTHEFRFKMEANNVRLRLAKAKVDKKREAAEKAPADADARAEFEDALKKYVEAEIKEYESRVAAYPTDRVMKFELGRRLFEAGRYEDCIAYLQEAKGEPKLKIRSQQYLGHAFIAIKFFDGAIETYRSAMEGQVAESELGMELRYGLMLALRGRAEENNDLPSAEEAYKIASGIAIQSFSYKDIRQQREALKELVQKLKGGGTAG
ncbi:MAG: tetratricopeptide repeat protein [Phycisphaerales bacterium]